MKILLILLFAISAFGQSIQDRVDKFEKPKDYKVKYDKFQKMTSVTFESSPQNDAKTVPYNMTIIGLVEIKDEGASKSFLYFKPSHQRVLYSSRNAVRFLIDGESFEVKVNDVNYFVIIPVMPDLLDKITAAKTIELQLATFECKLNDKTLTALKNLFSLTKPPPLR